MPDWREVRLRDLCDSVDYGLTARATGDPPGPRFLRITDIADGRIDWESVPFVRATAAQARRYRLHSGDIVIARTGSATGCSAWLAEPPDSVFASYLVRLKTAPDVSSRFVGYLLKSAQFRGHVAGVLGDKSAQPNASAATLAGARLRVPASRRVQEAIAEVLGALDDKITVNDRIVARSSDLVSALFRQALARPGSSSVPLNEAVAFDFGLPFASRRFNVQERGFPLLRIRDIRSCAPKVWTAERFAGDTVVAPGDVVAGMDARFRPAFWLGVPALLNQRVLRGRSLVAAGGLCFVREVLRTPLREAEARKTGTTVIHLNKRDLDLALANVPAAAELARFEAVAEPLRCRMVAAARESCGLAQLRDTLLPGLMSGAIGVRDAERAAGEVT